MMQYFTNISGISSGQLYTPPELSKILAKIVTLDKDKINSVYDPTCRAASLMLQVGNETPVAKYYGEDINLNNCYLARMNMLLHDIHTHDFDIQQVNSLEYPPQLENRFDAIVANVPFVMHWRSSENPNHITDPRFNQFEKLAPKGKADYAFLTHMLYHLADDGVMASVFPHGILFRGGPEGKIREQLIKNMNVIDAVIGLPSNIFNNTGIPTCILVLKKNRKPNDNIIFIDASGEDHYLKTGKLNTLRDEDIELIVDAYKKRVTNKHYSKAVNLDEVANNNFNLNVARYADSSNAAKEVEALIEQYGDYDYLRLEKVIRNIKSINKNTDLSNRSNVLYFPRQSILKIKSKSEIEQIKPNSKSNYYEIELDENIVLSEFITYFFESDLGQNLIKTKSSGITIQSITKDDLLNTMKIPVPSLSTQSQVISAYQLMNRVKESISAVQKELSLSPTTAGSVLNKLEGTLQSLNELSEEEQILSEIRKGESKTLEFKESFSLDVRQYQNNKKYSPKKEEHIERSSLKNVVGFINSDGGTLLIGVDDEGKVLGLEEEMRLFHKNSDDNFLLHFKNLTKDKIGPDFYSHFDANIKLVNNKKIMIVKCKKSISEPCYYDDEFYVRTNPATDKLSTKEANKYIAEHFKHNN